MLLAPMDGMTHAAFRQICFDYGADGATTEMIQALGFARAKKNRTIFDEVLTRLPGERFLSAQIIGCSPGDMAAAAERLTRLERFDAIEINMGCPARTVVGSGNGAAILQNPSLAIEIMRAVRASTDLPVRLKLRLGWDEDHIVAPELAAAAGAMGFQAVTLHGRTRLQMYRGEVNAAAIRQACRQASIPIYANGGVTCAEDAQAFLDQTSAAGLCIGRAALKQPWIFDDIRRLHSGEAVPRRDAPERIRRLVQLARLLCAIRPEKFAMREMRKFSGWWLAGLSGYPEALRRIYRIETLTDYEEALNAYLDGLERAGDVQVHPELMPEPSLDTNRTCRK